MNDRLFIGGWCQLCGAGFILVTHPNNRSAAPGYCTEQCSRRAARRRSVPRCPVPHCHRPRRPNHLVCGSCWTAVAQMCLGKRRISESAARVVASRSRLQAYWCRCCGWWHNGNKMNRTRGEKQARIDRVGLILQAIAEANGALAVADLIESWDPAVRSRSEWSKNFEDRKDTT